MSPGLFRLPIAAAALALIAAQAPLPTALPLQEGSLRFAVVGNSGHDGPALLAVGQELAREQEQLRFELVLLTGDNVHGSASPAQIRERFEEPYADLLDSAVKFRAVLGNHDDPKERFYRAFNMDGHRYYSFTPAGGVRVFALESSYMDRKQLAWLEGELGSAKEDWKIALLHHPLYSSDPGASQRTLRPALEPVLERGGVQVVFAGHEHAYERFRAPDGIQHFTSGAAGEARRRKNAKLMDFRFDAEASFMVCEIAGDRLSFEVVTPEGRIVDSGSLERRAAKPEARP